MLLGFDLETNSLDPHSGDILLYVFNDGKKSFYYDTLTEKCKNLILNNTLIGVNLKFDFKFLYKKGIIPRKAPKDLMIRDQILYSGNRDIPYDLKSIVKRYLGIDMDKSLQKSFAGISNKDITSDQKKYALSDVKHLLKIYKLQEVLFKKLDLKGVDKLESHFLPVLAMMEYNGCKINNSKLSELKKWIDNKETECLIEFKKEIEDNIDKLKDKIIYMNKKENSFPAVKNGLLQVNLNSPIQKRQVFSYILDENILNTDKNYLEKFSSYKLIEKYLRYSNVSEKKKKFTSKIENHVNEKTKKVHTEFFQILSTGRISSSSPNLQQIPSKGEFSKLREIFLGDYNMCVTSDYNAIELRIVAEVSKEETLIEGFLNGEDLHSKIACKVFNISDAKEKFNDELDYRTIAKTVNYGLIYGISSYGLARTIKQPNKVAEQIIKDYFRSMPKLKKWLDKSGSFAAKNGYSVTFYPIKRKRFFSSPKNDYEKSSIIRKGMNAPIQGCCADILKLAAIYTYKNLPPKSQIILKVHDELVSSSDYPEEMKKVQEENMQKAGKVFLKTVPVLIDTKIEKTWTK